MKWTGLSRRAAVLLAALILLLPGGCFQWDADRAPDPVPASSPSPSGSPTPEPAGTPPTERTRPPEPSPTPSPEEPPKPTPLHGVMELGESVEDDWFADAVFLGDSRTDGLMLYSGIRSATFISHQGLSVFNISTQACIGAGEDKRTALDVLADQPWAKVYLMLGVNELGYAGESFRAAYAELVEQIREIQPEATLYIQTILPVNESMAHSRGISTAINNERVRLFNSIIKEITAEQDAALVDVADRFWTAEGYMAPENTSDGVHLTRQGYVAWYEYLKCHTGDTPLVEFSPETPPAQEADASQPDAVPVQADGQLQTLPEEQDGPVPPDEGAAGDEPAQTDGSIQAEVVPAQGPGGE